MKITVEKDGKVQSIEPDAAIVLAMNGDDFLQVVVGPVLELGSLLGNSEPLAEHWDTLSKLVAIVKTMKADEDTVGGTEVLQ